MNDLLTEDAQARIQRHANGILERYRGQPSQIPLPYRIAADHGIRILEADLYDISGILKKDAEGWVIYVNKQDSPTRKLFTVAHELGHFFVHSDRCQEFVDGEFVTRDDDDKFSETELEANEFAGSLVMPEASVREELDGKDPTDNDIYRLAGKFKVSPLAMAIRLKNIGYAVPGAA